MKKLSLLAAILLFATTLSAQQKEWRTISISSCELNSQYTFTSGHQYSESLFFGFGAGIDKTARFNITSDALTIEAGGFAVPVFVDGKWRIFDTWLAPSLRMRTGAIFNVTMRGAGLFINPEIGLDISRYFTLTWGWNGQLLYTDACGWYRMSAVPLFGFSLRF